MGGPSGPPGGGETSKGSGAAYKKPPKPRGLVFGLYDAIKKGSAVDKKKRKEADINDSYLGSPDYQGDVKRPVTIKEVLAEREAKKQRDTDPNPNPKSVEQPKVASQMDNSKVKSKLITADKDAPTSTDATNTIDEAENILLKNKRKGRKKTVLTSVSGVEGYPTLSKKTLLGG